MREKENLPLLYNNFSFLRVLSRPTAGQGAKHEADIKERNSERLHLLYENHKTLDF